MAKEKNDEYSMARNQLRTAMTAIKRLMKHVEGEGELKAWVQSKLTKAADYMDSVADYMDSNDKVVKEARELSSDIHTILEAKESKKRLGFPGGPRAVEDIKKMGRAVAAAEAAIGLAILVVLFRNRRTINVEDLDSLKG